MQVYVATYTHGYGDDVRVFRKGESADAWRIEIADEYWTDAYHDMLKPDDKERMARLFWDAMTDRNKEFFNVQQCEIED